MTDLEKIEDWIEKNKFTVQCFGITQVYNVCSSDNLSTFIQSLKPKKEKLDFTGLHSKLQSRMKELKGSNNYKVQGKWNFIPSEKDLIDSLLKVCKKYKLSDTQKIQNLLLIHCERAVKADFNYVPLLGYYVTKGSISQLATDMENNEEINIEQKYDGINI